MHLRTTQAVFTDSDPRSNAARAVEKIRTDLTGFRATMVIFFSATDYDPEALAAGMRDAFPGAMTLGCTSAGEMIDDRLQHASVVAMAFSAGAFDLCESALIQEYHANSAGDDVFGSARPALEHLTRNLAESPIQLSHREYVGFILTDRVSTFSQGVVERLGELTDIVFVGGVAGDDCRFAEDERVFYDGRSLRDAAVLVLWRPRRGFDLLKTQAVELTDKPKLVVSKADAANRVALEFNHCPATKIYAEIIGADPATVDLAEFDQYPLAFAVDGEPYMRVISQKMENHGARIFGGAREGMAFNIARSTDIVSTTAAALTDKLAAIGPVAAILAINCISRHNTLKLRGQTEEYGALFRDLPGIAFSSYGEVYVGLIAMTSTMILFK